MQASPILSLSPSSPSFNTCSSGRLAEIAARVVEEFRQESGSCHEDDIYDTWSDQNQQYHQPEVIHEEEEEEEEDDDFEFAFVCKEPEISPIISADEIFYNGQIRPIYPLFNTKLLEEDNIQTKPADCKKAEFTSSSFGSKPKSHRLPLRKLMSEDRESSSSSSSSEADELDGLTPGSYCVWKPKGKSSGNDQDSPGRCKKSNSTGSSKRWKLKDLLYRSNSDGKDTFVFLAPSKREKTGNSDVKEIPGGKFKEADQEHFGSNRDLMKTEEKRKSFLPYRQDLVGIFSNVNGLSRNLHPF
ncbi:hypothetical protein COLO4_30037 [Corchorus olitorius]|uniref:Uncharacterized protein n=1 Tax=Corchorus olitorius TaxID=93759 RepID=A0A1R3HBE9_9ROSI|nr:hypothetical protein COLO4_30037 [Corchorus olitorius]